MKSPIKRIAVFDLETGGKDGDIIPITEIAMSIVDAEKLKVIDTFSRLVKPYEEEKYYTKEAEELTGITLDLLNKNGDTIKAVSRDLGKFLKKHKVSDHKPILAGHNIIKFDIPLLEKFFKKVGVKLDTLYQPAFAFDTMWISRFKWKNIIGYDLGACCQEIGVIIKESHRASDDTDANTELVISFLKSLRGDGGDVIDERIRGNIFEI